MPSFPFLFHYSCLLSFPYESALQELERYGMEKRHMTQRRLSHKEERSDEIMLFVFSLIIFFIIYCSSSFIYLFLFHF